MRKGTRKAQIKRGIKTKIRAKKNKRKNLFEKLLRFKNIKRLKNLLINKKK